MGPPWNKLTYLVDSAVNRAALLHANELLEASKLFEEEIVETIWYYLLSSNDISAW